MNCGGFSHHIFQTEPIAQLSVQGRILFLQLAVFQGAGDAHFQFIDLHPSLGNVIIGSLFHRIHGYIFRTVGGHQDADGRMRTAFGAADQIESILLAGHPQICQDHIEIFFFYQSDGGLQILCQVNIKMIFQCRVQSFAGRAFVINDQ